MHVIICPIIVSFRMLQAISFDGGSFNHDCFLRRSSNWSSCDNSMAIIILFDYLRTVKQVVGVFVYREYKARTEHKRIARQIGVFNIVEVGKRS